MTKRCDANAWLTAWGWIGCLAQPLAALTKGVGLPPVGQETTVPDTHEAMRHHVEQETSERPFEGMRCTVCTVTGPLSEGEGQYGGMALGVGKMRNNIRAEQANSLEHVPLVVQGRPK